MTTMERSPLVDQLIEDRLESIERLLMRAGKPRSERLAIIEEISSQIEEMLSRRVTGEPTSEEVLQVLSELDPPESFGVEDDSRPQVRPAREVQQTVVVSSDSDVAKRKALPIAYVGGGLALMLLTLFLGTLLLAYIQVDTGEGAGFVFAFYGMIFLLEASSMLCSSLGVYWILKSPRLYHGITSASLGLVGSLSIAFLFAGYAFAMITGEIWLIPLVAFLGSNVVMAISMIMALRLWRDKRIQQLNHPL
jgi:hypothetical protein